MEIALPDAPFEDIAADLRAYADNEALALEGVEVFIARYPHQAPAFADVVPRARCAAVTAGRLSALFNALVAHEETVRDFFAGLSSPSAVCPPRPKSGRRSNSRSLGFERRPDSPQRKSKTVSLFARLPLTRGRALFSYLF